LKLSRKQVFMNLLRYVLTMRRAYIFATVVAFAPISFAKCQVTTIERFAPFFSQFADSKEFADNRTLYPLKVTRNEYGVDANGRNASLKIQSMVSKAENASYPTLSVFMQTNSLESKRKTLSSRSAVVEVFRPDSDWLLSYHFQRRSNCWYLLRVEDHSP
jgi:chlorite dismutase